jgi:hypothetical protein
MSRTAMLLVILFVAQSLPLAGQARTVAEGDRVRVTLRHGAAARRLVGRITAVGRDTLFLNAEGQTAPMAIPKATIEKLEISTGQHGNAGRGALIGLGVGAIGGGIVGAADASHCNNSQSFCLFSSGGEMAIVATVFGAIGTVLGAVVGAISRSDRWETTPVQ